MKPLMMCLGGFPNRVVEYQGIQAPMGEWEILLKADILSDSRYLRWSDFDHLDLSQS